MRFLLVLALLLQAFALVPGSSAIAMDSAAGACGCACPADGGRCCPPASDEPGSAECAASLGTVLCACSAQPGTTSAEHASTLPRTVSSERAADVMVDAVAFGATIASVTGSTTSARTAPSIARSSACALLCTWRS